MVTEDYCDFEVAKLLKEKGFDIDECEVHYNSFDHTQYQITLQMAMKWLRRLYWLNMYPKYSKWSNKWSIVILSLDDREIIKGNTAIQIDGFVSYEEAVNEGIKYCLTNLIE